MRFLFVPVNYNSYDSLNAYIKAVGRALRTTDDETIQVDIHVADNSSKPMEVNQQDGLTICVRHYDNPGYLSAALKTIYAADIPSYDYIIISNVDVLVDESFFASMKDLEVDKLTAWIAPAIFSESEKRDVNPKIQERYSKKRLQQLRLLFRFPLLYHLYTQTVYRKKVITATQKPQQDIYAGHGSFMIFTSAFFQKCPKMDYPVFLFCEEIFLAEKVGSIGGKTTYCPSIKIHDKEHASTGKMKLSKYCKYNFEALTYIIRHFYE